MLLTTGGCGLSCPQSPVPRSHTDEAVSRFDQDLRRLPYLDLAIHGAKSSLHRTTDLDISFSCRQYNVDNYKVLEVGDNFESWKYPQGVFAITHYAFIICDEYFHSN